MSLDISIGNELKDSFKHTDKWASNGIKWMTDIEEFYREKAAIEKECATKLQALCKKHFDRKSKISTNLSVGDDPQVTPGSLESASLVLWNEVLSQTESIASERSKLAHEMESKVAAHFSSLQTKTEKVRNKLQTTNELIMKEREKSFDDVKNAKKAYDTLCQATETARAKNEKSSSDKHEKKLSEKETQMNIGKNEYLIKINIANRLKDKYFYQDLPEILDYYQELNEARVGVMNKVFKNANIIERNALDKIKEKLTAIDSVAEQNSPKLDTAMFVKHNLRGFTEPADFYYIPSSIWHDDENLIVKEPELTELKKRLNNSSSLYSKFENLCIESKQSLEELNTERKTGEINLSFDASLMKSIASLEKFVLDDNKRVASEVEIELIQNYAGDKDLTFVEPSKEKKSRFGFLKGKKSTSVNGHSEEPSLARSVTNTSTHTSHTAHSGFFNLRRNRAQSSASVSTTASTTLIGKANYAYQATGDDEVSMSAGEVVGVIDNDDGSGWTKISVNGEVGLVPTSYLEITASGGTANGTPKKKGPSVAPRRGGKKIQYVEAVYDYTAAGDDEISISAGDRIVLITADNGGWTEGELDGERGLFPSSYVKSI